MSPRARRRPAALAAQSLLAITTGLLLQLSAGGCDESSLRGDLYDSDVDNRPPVCGQTPNEVILMDACGLGAPCPSAHFYRRQSRCGGPLEQGEEDYDAAEFCVLQHLASGGHGRLALNWECDDRSEDAAIYTLGDGEVMLVTRLTTPCGDACACEQGFRYRELERCTLRDLEFFADCLEATAPGDQLACMDIENWFTGCGAAEPTCIP